MKSRSSARVPETVSMQSSMAGHRQKAFVFTISLEPFLPLCSRGHFQTRKLRL